MRVLVLACMFVAAAIPGAAAQTVQGMQGFYNAANFGTLGIVRSGKAAAQSTITVLQPDKTFSMAGQVPRTFYLNTDAAGVDHDVSLSPTYAMVLMFVAYPSDVASAKMALVAFRNENWWRSGCGPREKTCFDIEGDQSPSSDVNLHDRLSRDRLQSDVTLVDRDFGGAKFDGHPEDTNLESWDNRAFWNKKAQNEPICRTANTACVVKYYLLRFTPRANPTDAQPLTFYADMWSATAASVYVTSATNVEDFALHYNLVFTPQ